MSVLLIAYDDYANFMHGIANSLRSVGIECKDVKLVPHQFGYDTQSVVVGRENLIDMVPHFDLIIFFHTTHGIFELILPYIRGRLMTWHTGSTYRNDPEKANAIYNPYCEMTLTDQPEFMELGAKNIHYCAAAIDTTKLFPVTRQVKRPYIIGHYPSKPEVKGTHKIIEMLEPFKDKFDIRIDQHLVSHSDNLKRIAECDIYIELFKNELNGKPYGQFGVTAMEAAALGKMVITQNVYWHVYENSYNARPCLWKANNEEDFHRQIYPLTFFEPKYIMENQAQARDWLVKYHSYKATGLYLKNLLGL